MEDGGRPVREKRHRLPPEAYRGRRAVAFTACVQGRRTALDDPEIVAAFVEQLGEAAARHGCTVPIYCFMPDHLHALVMGENEASDAKRAMDRFKAASGWWLYRNRPGVRWQKDYWDHVVRAGLVADPFDWPHTGSIGYDVREIILDAHW